jgi:LacI family transcriptional regulator
MTTINDVARLANVSNATVSHVINKTRKVNPETIEKVEKAIKELNYRPNLQARSLKTGQSRLIGVLNYNSVDNYFAEVLTNIELAAYEAGYNVLQRHTERDGENAGAAISAWQNKNVDGLIFNTPVVTDEFRQLTQSLECPCVFLHIDDPQIKGDFLKVNDLESSEEAVRYLIGLGHRKIALIAGNALEYHTAGLRQVGYENALRQANISIRTDFIKYTDYGVSEGYEAFKNLMALPDPPTAVFGCSDMIAMGCIRAASDLGISIPGDVSVIGFDDIEMASFCTPRLTTIYQDKKKLGQAAVAQILKHIRHPELPNEQIVLPTHLVIRESTGPVKK